ncbi:hypothetical protein M8I34_00030 [Streptomyces sp. MCA2]|uniref:hypothetical protein n=1 Tax=Streptomyces sp. MCA2 TaxID=2944805 RepID=UPI002022697D|nr:hypothetical protein [Streptomyces sp. MCA2]MCL7489857.1 hypothetical protein [Streptomyces sp. MCA2]
MVTKRIAVGVGILTTITLAGVAATAAAGPAPTSGKASASASASALGKKAAKNYLYASIGDFDTEVKPLIDRPDVAGAQLVVPWKALEQKKNQYDFSEIDRALNYLQSRHKKLFIQIQDRFFAPPTRLPDYLLRDPEYKGGAAPTTNESGLGPGEPGAVAAQWNPQVRGRFQHLLKALAQRFDGRLAGVNLPETATGVDTKKDRTGYSHESYFKAELANMAYGKKVFTKTQFIQYVNFWPGEWNNSRNYMKRTFEFAASHGIGLGGPDVLPNRPAQMENSYPFFKKYRGKLPIVAMAVQEPDFEYKNPTTKKPYTREEFTDFGTNTLGANVMFWATSAPWLHQPAAR